MIKIKEMYLEDVTGKGEHILTLIGENGKKYQGETYAMGVTADVVYFRLKDEEDEKAKKPMIEFIS